MSKLGQPDPSYPVQPPVRRGNVERLNRGDQAMPKQGNHTPKPMHVVPRVDKAGRGDLKGPR